MLPDDVKALAPAALAHRIILNPASRVKDISAEGIVNEIVHSTPVPGTKL